MSINLKYVLRQCITREFLIDLEDGLRGEALKAFTLVRDHSGLDARRARKSVGYLRFPMMEKKFEEVGQLHGWSLLQDGLIPGSDLKIFQPFQRMENEGQGLIIGLAAVPDPKMLPSANKSRKAGVSLNYDLVPRLDFDGTGPKIGDIFALLLVARDRERAGQIEEIAVGVIDSEYENFLFYEALDKFVGGAEDTPDPTPSDPSPKPPAPLKLKSKIVPFVPPEERNGEEGKTGTE